MKLVSLDMAKLHLEVDHDEDDPLIDLFIEAGSQSVLNYLKDGALAFLDSNGEVELDEFGEPVGIPSPVKTSVLFMVGTMFRNRDENPDEIFKHGYLPYPVMSMLYPYRDPALA